MSKPFALYPPHEVPPGFVYPQAFQDAARSGEYPDIYPWWFVDASSEAGRLFLEVARQRGSGLVPFAKVDDGRDDIACFEMIRATGAPSVRMLILDDATRTYSFDSFEDWLRAAMTDAKNWTD
jgi:hypothetical protein